MIVLKGVQCVKDQFVCFAALAILWKKENANLSMEIPLLDVKNIFHKTRVSYAKRGT